MNAQRKKPQEALEHERQLSVDLLYVGAADVCLALSFVYSDPCISEYILLASLSNDALRLYVRSLGASCRVYEILMLALVNLSSDV